MLEPIAVEDVTDFKRNLISEFSALYMNTTEPLNMSSIRQVSETGIEVALEQYPEQGIEHDVIIFDELNRLRFFGWQIRSIKYDKDATLFIYFEKIDRRNVNFYRLVPDKYNNEQDLWWLEK